jgi:ATP-dependent RNA helicase DDX49/DBP8
MKRAWGKTADFSSTMSQGSSDSSSNGGADDFPESPSKRRKVQQTLNPNEIPVPSRIKRKPKAVKDPSPVEPSKLMEKVLDTESFQSLGVDSWLITALSSMQINLPTPIQAKSIPAILAGSDCIGGSKTGSGKTVAFSVPILQKWAEDQFGIFALILTPTR